MRRIHLVAVVVALALLGSAPAAGAAEVEGDGSVTFVAAPGEANDVTATLTAGGVRIRDAGAVITRGPHDRECTISADGHEALCASPAYLSVTLGDGNDRAAVAFPTAAARTHAFVNGDAGDDRLTATGPRVGLFGGEGRDVLDGTGPAVTLEGDGGDDRMTARSGEISALGGDGDDVIAGTAAFPRPAGRLVDHYFGGAGNDVISAGPGADYIKGGAGDDRIDAGAGDDYVSGDHRLESIPDPEVPSGAPGNDHLSGGPGNDDLTGALGDDAIGGGDGDDMLRTGPGADSMSGGNGRDRISYVGRTAPVVASLEGGTGFGEPGENDSFAGDVEELWGGDGDDSLTGNGDANRLYGGPGADVIDAGGGRGDAIFAGDGEDLILSYDGPRAFEGPVPDFMVGDPRARNRDDFVWCDLDNVRLGVDHDTAMIDASDVPQSPEPRLTSGCETTVFGPGTVGLRPGQSRVTVPVPCPDSATRCRGDLAVRAIRGKNVRSQLTARSTSRRLGAKSFVRNGKRGRRAKVKLSRRALRRAGRGKRVRAVVTYRFRRR